MAAVSSSTTIAATGSQRNPLLFFPKTLNPTKPSFLPFKSNQTLAPVSMSITSQSSKKQASFSRIRAAASSLVPDPGSHNPDSRTLKSRLAAGETLYGLFLLSFSPTLAEIAGLAGYDYVVVDMEHGPGGIAEALPCLRALAAARTPAILRLPEPSAAWAKKALDLGPQGLMFPTIETPAAAELAVSYCRFPPRGVRGSAHTLVRASAYGIDDGYLARVEEELLVMCQVETTAGVAEIEAIAAVEGVDVVQMGPLDLSASMGYLWDPGNRNVRGVMKDAERRVLGMRKKVVPAEGGGGERGPYLGGFAMPHDRPEDLKLRGYHMVAGAVDLGIFRQVAVEDVRRWRSAEVEIGEEDDEDEKAKDDEYWSE
ncbi:2-keto-3-deoxy-L-rhamnonate aldolase-like [Phoenix dactylifera]|uniref:2-keto-3-deoxy-L-rhamnonate aldolase-like n=1 Tax=Phoenix dactylifera TaxID=42345 RepID=A0A8B7CNL7_PHODC|nr:2-keto-3-deoxy-L-rhamnonate aldolase-like [Phoenix dactylifera]